MLTALVIDDEQFAREELAELLDETGQVEVVGDASNAILGLKKINELKPDVVFLDIQMPQVTGIELLGCLIQKPCLMWFLSRLMISMRFKHLKTMPLITCSNLSTHAG